MMLKKSLLAISLAVSALSAQAAAFTNGSFEGEWEIGTTSPVTLGDSATDINGWTTINGTSWVSGVAQDGDMYVNLSANNNAIYQTFDTVAGTTYTLTYYTTGNGSSVNTVYADLYDGSGFDFSTLLIEASGTGTGVSGLDWFAVTTTFTAVSNTTSLYFTANNNSGFAGVDNVSLTTAVPEPESYAMLLAGLGAVGFVSRRRKQQQA